MKKLLSILVMLFSVNGIHAQLTLQSYLDIGENNASEGVFVKNVYRGTYQYKMCRIESGIQFDLHSNNPNALTGFDMIGSGEFSIKNFPFQVSGYFILNRFSDLLHDTNWGIKIETRKLQHFLFALGTNSKTYVINSAAREKYNIGTSESKLSENFMLIYVITAYVKPYGNVWNVGLSCTNVDYYIINQSTNPVFNVQMTYKQKSDLTLFLDAWYKQAGIFNISANYFGYFFRGGVIWEI